MNLFRKCIQIHPSSLSYTSASAAKNQTQLYWMRLNTQLLIVLLQLLVLGLLSINTSAAMTIFWPWFCCSLCGVYTVDGCQVEVD